MQQNLSFLMLDGSRRAVPVFLGYIPLGIAFGVLAVQNGIPALIAVFMSLFVYTGAGQLIAIGLWGSGTPLLSIILTVFVVNLRHVLMAAALVPWLSRLGIIQQSLIGAQITDETFALHCAAMHADEQPQTARLIALNSTAHLGWVGGTFLGVVAGDLLADPKLLGLDFALPAMFIALLIPYCKNRYTLFVSLLAGLLSVGFVLLGAGRWNVIFATLITATVASTLQYYTTIRSLKKEHTS